MEKKEKRNTREKERSNRINHLMDEVGVLLRIIKKFENPDINFEANEESVKVKQFNSQENDEINSRQPFSTKHSKLEGLISFLKWFINSQNSMSPTSNNKINNNNHNYNEYNDNNSTNHIKTMPDQLFYHDDNNINDNNHNYYKYHDNNSTNHIKTMPDPMIYHEDNDFLNHHHPIKKKTDFGRKALRIDIPDQEFYPTPPTPFPNYNPNPMISTMHQLKPFNGINSCPSSPIINNTMYHSCPSSHIINNTMHLSCPSSPIVNNNMYQNCISSYIVNNSMYQNCASLPTIDNIMINTNLTDTFPGVKPTPNLGTLKYNKLLSYLHKSIPILHSLTQPICLCSLRGKIMYATNSFAEISKYDLLEELRPRYLGLKVEDYRSRYYEAVFNNNPNGFDTSPIKENETIYPGYKLNKNSSGNSIFNLVIKPLL